MNRRITITLDPSLEEKIREIQAKKIVASKKAISFSEVVNNVLKEGLKTLN